MLLYKFAFGPVKTNAILIVCTQTNLAVAIDPSQGSAASLLKKAEEHHASIQRIFLTHSHWDHLADLYELKKKIDAPVYVHPLDASNVEHPGSDGIPLFTPIQGVKIDHFLHDGDLTKIGKLKFEVIHTPGHSPGSVCFYSKEESLLISGDTLFQGTMGRVDLPTGQKDLMWKSLEKLSKLPPETRVIPGHGGETLIGKEPWLARAKQIFSE